MKTRGMKIIGKNGKRGQGLTEYLILVLLVAVVSIAAAKSLGGTVKRKLELAQRHINSDVNVDE